MARQQTNTDDADDVHHHPVLAVSHGPGPLWLLKHGVENRSSKPARNVASIFKKLYPGGANKPKQILLVSAHWETYRVGFEISKSPAPGMLYDYEGFPPEAYKAVYAAKGDSDFANEVSALLSRSKIKATQVLRAFDHAAFVPMTLIRRQADIPVVTLSINWKLNARAHFELGRALAPLRDQDTLIICSGQATHGLPGHGDDIPQSGLDFQECLVLFCAATAVVLSGVPSTSVSAELVPLADVHNAVNSPVRELREDVVKVHVQLHGKETEAAPEKKKVVKKHKHKHKHKSRGKEAEEEVSEDGEVVRNYDHGSVRIQSKEKSKEKHKKKKEKESPMDETVVEYNHASVKIKGKKASATTNDNTKEETKEAIPNEKEIIDTASEATEVVTKLSSTSPDKKSILDTYGPVVMICGIIGAVAAIVGVVGLVVAQRQNQKDGMDSVLEDSADLDVDVEAGVTAAEGKDTSSDGKDCLNDSDSDANDDEDEEEGTFANNSGHVSV
ncbi:hypothetical protein PHYBOEH_002661 [Phytophthora boehmeriae]|uniref:Extradiol ring-cleavage dioxygenase class III enzyme subunit B domain-containing protein n=1 Tax=Phytophthora boehmeriae TaxID=109152 RepID=A0A8T1WU27_9STRA|nr:hypothetical protein PHYBOEH_002661 [Phytophthora boehmeriae]